MLSVASQVRYFPAAIIRIEELISFKGAQYPKSVILYAVYFYVRFPISYRDLEEIMAERGVDLDHATLNRWVEKYAGAIAEEAHRRKAPTVRSWRMDETYVKVKGEWTYLYRAIDKEGKTLDFMLSERRDEAAATAFFVKAIGPCCTGQGLVEFSLTRSFGQVTTSNLAWPSPVILLRMWVPILASVFWLGKLRAFSLGPMTAFQRPITVSPRLR